MITNQGNISLPMAIWLASDEYDHDPSPNSISATELLKSVKQIILGNRVTNSTLAGDSDLQDQVASAIGTAIHNAVEHSIVNLREDSMKKMGIPARVRDLIRVNPTINDPNCHNIYLEQRVKREIDGFVISGKYDIVENGRVKDIKSTSCYTFIYGTNNSKYAMQGSIYRWLSPKLITDDHMDIEFVFIDWKALAARTEPNYPPRRVMSKTIPLVSIQQTEIFIREKLAQLVAFQNEPEANMEPCTRDELWQKPTTYAYFKNPAKLKRATRVFPTNGEALSRHIEDGSVGIIKKRPGKAIHCNYCTARPICAQAERLTTAGLLD